MRKLFLYVALLLLSQCSKCKDNDPAPEAQLPPATQTGANTFGCLVNGQPWTPQGNFGYPNYAVSYDRTASGGVLFIQTYRIDSREPEGDTNMTLLVGTLPGVNSYSLRDWRRSTATFNDQKRRCSWRSTDSTTTTCRGSMTITRLDLTAGIISGTFAFTLYKPGCDSVRVTQGRFDKKL
ncbi:DUF6252 family protein [Hymenobacter puniceus]|uniref:DUF6252 family protein n=1 Tax=Hymenobacter sp. BT190 TaxID=2763505 RepID=UPI00165100B5|nr:DUF6252 family protein [Hymenobacter sp. BT190]MBC6699972.1 hypothetical protein [Hymenobacter sp. BT190]